MAHHRPGPHARPGAGPYTAVCNVLPDGTRPPGFAVYDDDGGLPDRNAAYCELSVLHRLQLRATTPVVGLAHYRRVLLHEKPSARPGELPGTYLLPDWDWADERRAGADEGRLLAALGDRDWCTPLPFDVRRAGFRSLHEQFVHNHPAALLAAVDAALHAVHPRLPAFSEHLLRTCRTPLFNMFLGRREALDQYGDFLWPVLDRCGASPSAAAQGAYQGRWAGFLGERLHGYWLEHLARPEGLRTGVLPVGLLDAAAPGATRFAASAGRSFSHRVPAPLVLYGRLAVRFLRSSARSPVGSPGRSGAAPPEPLHPPGKDT